MRQSASSSSYCSSASGGMSGDPTPQYLSDLVPADSPGYFALPAEPFPCVEWSSQPLPLAPAHAMYQSSQPLDLPDPTLVGGGVHSTDQSLVTTVSPVDVSQGNLLSPCRDPEAEEWVQAFDRLSNG